MSVTMILKEQALTMRKAIPYRLVYRIRKQGIATGVKEEIVQIVEVDNNLELCTCCQNRRKWTIRYEDIMTIRAYCNDHIENLVFPLEWLDVGDLVD